MSEPDDRVERAYRSLAREEPPASLDASILAAARRAVARPSLARRWGVPLSAAAVLALAIGVTLEMQHERPGIGVSAPASESAATPEVKREMAAPSSAPEARREPALAAPSPAQADVAKQAPRAQLAPSIEAAPAAPAPPAAAEGRLFAPTPSMAKRSAAAGASADTLSAPASPAAQLERIAKLREEGRDAEADRALEEFRKRFPAYRIDDAAWQRVKPR